MNNDEIGRQVLIKGENLSVFSPYELFAFCSGGEWGEK